MPQEIGQIYKTLIPSLSDDASVEEAFQMYHYGTAAYNGNNLQPQSIEKHLIDLNEDVSRIDSTIAGLANVYIEETSTTARPNIIVSQESVVVPLTVRGVINQAAALQKWQKNTGSVSDVALISNTGAAAFDGYLSIGSTSISATTGVSVVLGGDHKGVTVRGVSGQTANLQEWQNNSGTVLSRVDSGGNLHAPNANIQNLTVTGDTNLNIVNLTDDLTAHEIFADKITLDGATGLVVDNISNLNGTVNILGVTNTKNIAADGTITATGNISSNGNVVASGDLQGANLSLSQSLTTTGNITADGIIRAKSPNQGTTGGVRIRGDVNGNSYLQFVNAGDTTEFGNIKGTTNMITISPAATVSGALTVNGSTSLQAATVVSPTADGSGGTNNKGVRNIYVSTANATTHPTFGLDGDIWIKYV